jgi:hypothetical protein
MKLRFRSARRLLVVLKATASLSALIVTIPCVIILFGLFFAPIRDWTPWDTFYKLRRSFFRVLSGRSGRAHRGFSPTDGPPP